MDFSTLFGGLIGLVRERRRKVMAKEYKRSFVLQFAAVADGADGVGFMPPLEKGVVVNGILILFSPSAAIAGPTFDFEARALGTIPQKGVAPAAAGVRTGRDMLNGTMVLSSSQFVYYLPVNHVSDGDEPIIGCLLTNRSGVTAAFSVLLDVFVPGK